MPHLISDEKAMCNTSSNQHERDGSKWRWKACFNICGVFPFKFSMLLPHYIMSQNFLPKLRQNLFIIIWGIALEQQVSHVRFTQNFFHWCLSEIKIRFNYAPKKTLGHFEVWNFKMSPKFLYGLGSLCIDKEAILQPQDTVKSLAFPGLQLFLFYIMAFRFQSIFNPVW